MSAYSTLPFTPSVPVEPYKVDIPQSDVDDLKALLKLTRVPKETFENSRKHEEDYGITREWFQTARQAWMEFDWKKQQDRMNAQNHYLAKVANSDGREYTVHFMGLFSKRDDAVPIVFSHGWPGSFLEFLPMLELVRKQYTEDELPYHLIVPSLPGFTLSSPPTTEADFGFQDLVMIFGNLMKGLGFKSYIAQGGDVGSGVIDGLASQFDECKAIHANNRFVQSPPKGTPEYEHMSKNPPGPGTFFQKLMPFGYALEQGTKPATIGLALGSSPMAMLSWIGEKYLAYSDPQVELETILTIASLYWFTDTYPSSIFIYRQFMGPKMGGMPPPTKKPLGYSVLPKDLATCPTHWVEKVYNLVWVKEHDRGGHFAFLEQTESLWQDLEEYVAQVWKDVNPQVPGGKL